MGRRITLDQKSARGIVQSGQIRKDSTQYKVRSDNQNSERFGFFVRNDIRPFYVTSEWYQMPGSFRTTSYVGEVKESLTTMELSSLWWVDGELMGLHDDSHISKCACLAGLQSNYQIGNSKEESDSSSDTTRDSSIDEGEVETNKPESLLGKMVYVVWRGRWEILPGMTGEAQKEEKKEEKEYSTKTVNLLKDITFSGPVSFATTIIDCGEDSESFCLTFKEQTWLIPNLITSVTCEEQKIQVAVDTTTTETTTTTQE